MYTADDTPSVIVVRNKYAHARNGLCMLTIPKSVGNFKQESQGNGWFATDSQGCILTSDSDPKTGTFPQTGPTAGDSACTVKEV